MELVLLICRMKIVRYNFLLFLIFWMFSNSAFADQRKSLPSPSLCHMATLALESGRELYQRGQYLLSVQEFSLAEKFDCPESLDQARWGHLLALTQLGEREEMFYLSHKAYPSKLSTTYQQKLKLYQSFYFSKNESSSEALRVESFNQWKDSLPVQKSPVLAGTMSAVLPGSGQAYTGSWQSGAMAFVLNALFLSATLELADKDLNAAAVVSGAVFSITYLGNILNAAESARIYNQNFYAPQIEEEKNKRFPELNL